jgi:hypothetical protein
MSGERSTFNLALLRSLFYRRRDRPDRTEDDVGQGAAVRRDRSHGVWTRSALWREVPETVKTIFDAVAGPDAGDESSISSGLTRSGRRSAPRAGDRRNTSTDRTFSTSKGSRFSWRRLRRVSDPEQFEGRPRQRVFEKPTDVTIVAAC